MAKIEFNKSKKIQLNYNLKSSFIGASKLANRFYLRSYNSVFKGNKDLENEMYHNARIRYTRFSMFRGLQMAGSLNLNYTKKIRGVTNIVEFDNSNLVSSQRANQFLTIQMIDNPLENWTLTGFIYKLIKKIKYKLSIDVDLSKYLQNIDSKTQTNKRNNYSMKIGAETFFRNFPTIEVGYRKSIGNYISGNYISKFTTNKPFINIDYDFLKGFIFSFDYTRYDYQNKTQNLKNLYELANATLSYKNEDSAWSYKLTVQNLFDTTFKQSNSFSGYLISDSKTYILPRVIMFSIEYNL